MAMFGKQNRSATEDANAGVVNPPAKRTAARNTVGTSNKELSQTDKAMGEFGEVVGNKLGDALNKMVEEKRGSANARKQLAAGRRQGTDKAVNAIDEVKKRTSWERAIFGDNVEYRAAQQRAVVNGINSEYNEAASDIDSWAGTSPEEYAEMRQQSNDELLAEYKGDPETQQKVLEALVKTEGKLAGAHQKAFYANNQLQQQETARQQKKIAIDSATIERDGNISLSEKKTHMKGIAELMSGGNRAPGMSPLADRLQTLDIVAESMSKGNAGPMLAIQGLGLPKNFSMDEQVKWDKALAKYDTKYGQKADLIRTNFKSALASALTPDEAESARAQQEKDLTELFRMSSGTMQSKLVQARGELEVSLDEQGVRERAETQDKALKDAAKAAVTAKDKELVAGIKMATEDMRQAILDSYGKENVKELQAAAINTRNATVKQLTDLMSNNVAQRLKVEKSDTQAAQAKKQFKKEKVESNEAAAEKQAELAKEQARNEGIDNFFTAPTTEERAALKRDLDITPKELKEGFDTYLIKQSQKYIGGDELPTSEEFGIELQKNPQLQRWVAGEMRKNKEITSPILKTTLASASSDLGNLYDENGNATERGLDTVNMVDTLTGVDKGVSLIGGAAKHREWRLTSMGVKAGSGQKHLEDKLADYRKNSKIVESLGIRWSDITGDSSKEQWATTKMDYLGIENPTRQTLSTFIANYQLDMVAFGGDQEEADRSAKARLHNNKTSVFGSVVQSDTLDKVTSLGTEGIIEAGEKVGLMTPKYATMMGQGPEAETPYTSHREIPNMMWYIKDGEDGIFGKAPSANDELHISTREMQDFEKIILKRREDAANLAKSKEKYSILAVKDAAYGVKSTKGLSSSSNNLSPYDPEAGSRNNK